MELVSTWDRYTESGFVPTIVIGRTSARTLDQLARNNCFGHLSAAYEGVALHLRCCHSGHRAPADYGYFYPQLVAGTNRPAELRSLDSGEYHHFVAAIFDFRQQQGAAGLRNGFHDQNPWHNRQARKVPNEKRFIDRHVLDCDNTLPALQFQDPIDQ